MALNEPCKQKAGFTLAEILLAMMVFAIAITTILGLLARSIEMADSILVKDEAISLSSAVDSYMTELPFNDAFKGVVDGTAVLYAYQYRAKSAASGTLTPYPTVSDTDQPEKTYLVVPGVRDYPSETSLLQSEEAAREGRLFQVHLSVSEANPLGKNLAGKNPDSVDPSSGYNSAVLVIYAEFYEVPSVTSTKINTNGLTPVFSYNFAVRR